MRGRFAEAVTAAITNGFEVQASAHGASLHAKAVAIRAKDPLATFLTDTFTRQVRERAAGADAARKAGDVARAKELAKGAMIAAANLSAVQDAVEGR